MSTFGNVEVHRSLLRELAARYGDETLISTLIQPAVKAGFGDELQGYEAKDNDDDKGSNNAINDVAALAHMPQESATLHELLDVCLLYTRISLSQSTKADTHSVRDRLRRLFSRIATHTMRGSDVVSALMQRTVHVKSLATTASLSPDTYTTTPASTTPPYTSLTVHNVESAGVTTPVLDDVEQYIVAYCVYLDGLVALWKELFASTTTTTISPSSNMKRSTMRGGMVGMPNWAVVLTGSRRRWQGQLMKLTQELFYRIAAQQLPLELYALYILYVSLTYRVRLFFCIAQLASCTLHELQPVPCALAACAGYSLQCEVTELQKLWDSTVQSMAYPDNSDEPYALQGAEKNSALCSSNSPVHTSCPFMTVLHGFYWSLRGRAALLFSDTFPALGTTTTGTTASTSSAVPSGSEPRVAIASQDRHVTERSVSAAVESGYAARISLPSLVSSSSFARSPMTNVVGQAASSNAQQVQSEKAVREGRGRSAAASSNAEAPFRFVYPSPTPGMAEKERTVTGESIDTLRPCCGGCMELANAIEHLLRALSAWPATLLLVTDHGTATAAMPLREYSTGANLLPYTSLTTITSDATNDGEEGCSSSDEEEEEDGTSGLGGMACWTLNAILPNTRHPATTAAQCAEQSGMLLRVLAFRLAGCDDEEEEDNGEENEEDAEVEGGVAFTHTQSAFYVLPLYTRKAKRGTPPQPPSDINGRTAKVYLVLHLRLTTREECHASELLQREAGKCWTLLRAVQAALTQQTWCAQAAALCTV